MKARPDPVTLPNFLSVAQSALRDSGIGELAYLCSLHLKAIRDGEIVHLLAAGTGYTWAASAVRAGSPDTAELNAVRELVSRG